MIARMNLLPMPPKPAPDEAQREGAESLHAMYRSYLDAGFDKRQAMEILLEMIRCSMAASSPPKRPS